MVMALGSRRAGWSGLRVAGACFILPAACLTAVLAALYVRYGAVPFVADLLAGLGPAVVVVMALGTWRLGRSALSSVADGILAAVVVALALAGVDQVLLLLGAAVVGAAGGRILGLLLAIPAGLVAAVLYGGGYVLIALLQGAVDPRGWMTARELVDAVAAGQVTPGPVLTTATFAGFLMGGPTGAVVATVAIFLPAFLFTSLLGPYTERIRASASLHRAVRTVSIAAVAIMGAVTVELASMVVRSPWAAVPLGLALVMAVAGRSTPVVLAAGMAGALATALMNGTM
jgi:chromate transporter